MKLKQLKLIALLMLVTAGVLLAVWCHIPENELTGDALKYAKMQKSLGWFFQVQRFRSKLPEAVGNWLYLIEMGDHFMNQSQAFEKELVASGFFTNTRIIVTNLPAGLTNDEQRMSEMTRRISAAACGTNFGSYYVVSNACVLTCKSELLSQFQKALNTP